ncbi:MAG: 3-oxoacyl-[acyl-carrier-protein] reductase [Bacteroidia bacterium]
MTSSPIVLITGGSSGLGLATARRFASAGWHTLITGRNEDTLRQAADDIGGDVHPLRFDMDDLHLIPDFVQRVVAQTGRIDALVNNAGINHKLPFTEVSDADFARIVHTNQAALFALSREVVKQMLIQPTRGNIVNISSMAAQYGIPKVISYTAAKTAVEGMTRAMAVELGSEGIRVNCVAPGFVRTPMSSRALDNDPERKHKVLSRTPMGKLDEPADVANAVFFLASDQAAYITGVTLRVDGGNAIGF